MKKNILMICYYYPPLTDVGCKRSVAFSKYFKKHGWNPFVLSVKNPDKAYCSLGTDEPPIGVCVEYTRSILNPYRFLGRLNGVLSRVFKLFGVNITRNYLLDIFCIPDIFFGWIPLTLLKGMRIIKNNNIDIIYASSTPYSGAIIGSFLKSVTGKPLVLDFRDPFALEKGLFLKVPKFRRFISRYIEEHILKRADVFIVTSDETKMAYIEQYPIIREKTFTVYNGFDLEYLIEDKVKKHDKFTIIYAGEFYSYAQENNVYTKIFFESLSLLKKGGKISGNDFQFLFYGDGREYIEEIAKNYGVDDLVVTSARIPYKELLNTVAGSHLQLLRIIKLMISTKLYEGIPLNVPFLATIPKGEVEAIVEKYSPNSYVITEESAERVANAILDAMLKHENNEIQDNYVQEFLGDFSREHLTCQLMQILEEL